MAGLSSYIYPQTNVPTGGASNASNVTPLNAAASFGANNSLTGSASLAGNPLPWLLVLGVVVLVVLHTI